MMVFPMAESSVKMSLKYDGRDVDLGTMPVEDVIGALQGFSGAYGKVASSLLPQSSHEIRVAAFSVGSFDVSIVGWVMSAQGQEALKELGLASKAALVVIGVIKGYIELKKHVKSKPYQVNVEGSNNTVLVINADGASQEATRESLKLLQSKLIDADLAKIVKPLEEGSVDRTTISAIGDEKPSTTIDFADKLSFALDSAGETFQDATLIGTLISNNKETRKGLFASGNGERVRYHYTGANPELFQSTYTFSGKVKVSGRAFFDENLKLKRVDITDAVKVQQELEFTESPQALQLSKHGETDQLPSQE